MVHSHPQHCSHHSICPSAKEPIITSRRLWGLFTNSEKEEHSSCKCSSSTMLAWVQLLTLSFKRKMLLSWSLDASPCGGHVTYSTGLCAQREGSFCSPCCHHARTVSLRRALGCFFPRFGELRMLGPAGSCLQGLEANGGVRVAGMVWQP